MIVAFFVKLVLDVQSQFRFSMFLIRAVTLEAIVRKDGTDLSKLDRLCEDVASKASRQDENQKWLANHDLDRVVSKNVWASKLNIGPLRTSPEICSSTIFPLSCRGIAREGTSWLVQLNSGRHFVAGLARVQFSSHRLNSCESSYSKSKVTRTSRVRENKSGTYFGIIPKWPIIAKR